MSVIDFPEGNFKHGDITEKVIGAFFTVYNDLGYGFLEIVYHKAMLIALAEAGLHAETQVNLPVYFHGHLVGDFYADIFVERAVIVELKAADALVTTNDSQLLNYLKASLAEVGLLLNFGPKPKFKRLAFDNDRKRSRPPIEFS